MQIFFMDLIFKEQRNALNLSPLIIDREIPAIDRNLLINSEETRQELGGVRGFKSAVVYNLVVEVLLLHPIFGKWLVYHTTVRDLVG